jgi:excinuclease ABC subunit A
VERSPARQKEYFNGLLDVISSADWIIDMGPEGGNKGGQIVFEGTPKELLGAKQSLTSKYLKQ